MNRRRFLAGGGTGMAAMRMSGGALALAAARNGLRVIMTEETDRIGGSSQPRPSRPMSTATSGSSARLELTGSSAPRSANTAANTIRGRPKVGLAVLEAMLAPYIRGSRIALLAEHKLIAATMNRDRVESVRVRDLRDGRELDLSAPFFLDATEVGDLLPMSGTEFVTGAESKAQTGELHAPARAAAPQHTMPHVVFRGRSCRGAAV